MAFRPRSRVSSVTTPIRLAPTADNGGHRSTRPFDAGCRPARSSASSAFAPIGKAGRSVAAPSSIARRLRRVSATSRSMHEMLAACCTRMIGRTCPCASMRRVTASTPTWCGGRMSRASMARCSRGSVVTGTSVLQVHASPMSCHLGVGQSAGQPDVPSVVNCLPRLLQGTSRRFVDSISPCGHASIMPVRRVSAAYWRLTTAGLARRPPSNPDLPNSRLPRSGGKFTWRSDRGSRSRRSQRQFGWR